MAKASIAIAAFALGFFCSTLFSSQSEHPGSSKPVINWPDWHTNVFEGVEARGFKGNTINLAGIGAVPFFNTLNHMPVFKRLKISSGNQAIDGLNCENCEFENASLRYSGGVMNLKGSTFSGTTTLQLEGAAANTVALLEFLKAIPKDRAQLTYKLPIPNRPIIRKFAAAPVASPTKPSLPEPQKMDFIPPYIGPR